MEHPAGGYKKLFETVEELSSPVTAHVTGWCALTASSCATVSPVLISGAPGPPAPRASGASRVREQWVKCIGDEGFGMAGVLGVEEEQIGCGILGHFGFGHCPFLGLYNGRSKWTKGLMSMHDLFFKKQKYV